MNRYLIRAAKYCIYLFLLIFILLGLMSIYDTRGFAEVYLSTRGLAMLGIVAVFALTYPLFGFVKKTLTFDATQKAEDVERIMAMSGYSRVSGTNDAMVFRATRMAKKIMLMWEDQITITTADGLSTMSGPRKEVVKASFRFGTYVS